MTTSQEAIELAQAIIEAADRRAAMGYDLGQIQIRYGVVSATDLANRTATVKLAGMATGSPGFAYGHHVPTVNDRVRVVILPTGDRYIDEDFGKLWKFDFDGALTFYGTPGDANPQFRVYNDGDMEWGPGGASAVDVSLRRTAASVLALANGDRLIYQPVGCSLFRSTTQSIPNGTWTAVIFNEADLSDPFGMHDPSTNNTRITIPTGMGGAYRVTGQGSFNANITGSRFLGLSFNAGGAAEVNQVGGPPTTAHNYRLSLSGGVYEMAAGDYVELLCWQDAGGNLNLNYATLYLHYVGEIA